MSTSALKAILVIITIFFAVWGKADAVTVRLDASSLVSNVELSMSPKSGSFVEGSTFDVPILVNTNGNNINGIEVRINFDRNKLEIIKPSSGLSIIGVWVEPPGYDNTRGTASYVGVIPNGITTNAGLVGTITFRAKSAGKAIVSFSSNSKVLLNDGQGTEARLELSRSEYTLLPKTPEGVNIFSETHPFQSNWYNNKSPVISWDKDAGVSGFAFVLDHEPQTIPESKVNISETSKQFENLNDGLWYFHIKASKNGVWGTTGHFLIRIDTTPPADFKPVINYLLAAVGLTERALVSFFTTDNLSGVDHYEVGALDKNQSTTVSPAFVQTESPFQLPLSSDKLEVVVRAVDKAGNIRDVSMPIAPPSFITKFLQENLVYILLFIILAGFIGLIIHYLVGHHILRYLKKARELVKKEEQANIVQTTASVPPPGREMPSQNETPHNFPESR